MNNKLQIDTLYEHKRKKSWICYLMWLFLGGIGGQHFYIQGSSSGYAWLMVGLLVVCAVFPPLAFINLLGALYGLFIIRRDVRLKNLEIKMSLEEKYGE